jgi:hypothetical protein
MMSLPHSMSILKAARTRDWRNTRWMTTLRHWGGYATAAIVRLKEFAPYALIELVLPGGSVMALLLWLYRRSRAHDVD